MTAERNKSETDRLVSQTYRELGSEKVPEHLNQTILRQAAAAGRRGSAGHFSLTAWTKPVAWAATIGISLAIVLELTQIPAVPLQDAAPSAPPSVSSPLVPHDTTALDEAKEMARQQAGPNRQEALKDETVAPSSFAARESKLKPMAPSPAVVSTEADSEEVNILSVESKGSSGMISQPAADRSFAKMQAAAEPAARERAESEVSGYASTCDVATQASADNWMECIQNLRETGATEQADREYEAFLLKYPAE